MNSSGNNTFQEVYQLEKQCIFHRKFQQLCWNYTSALAKTWYWRDSFSCLGPEHWAQSPVIYIGPRDRKQPQAAWTGAEGWAPQSSQLDGSNHMPLMDHWNASRPFVSLRDIIKEEQALQERMEKVSKGQILGTYSITNIPNTRTTSRCTCRQEQAVQPLTERMELPS